MADAQKRTALDPVPYGAGTGRRSAIHPQAGAGGKLVLDGTTDNSAALAGLVAGVGYDLPAGTCYVGASCTVVARVKPQPGFVLQPDAGVEVTLAEVDDPAAFYWIDLSLGGTVKFERGAVRAINVAWYGADHTGATFATDALHEAMEAAKELAADNHEIAVEWPSGRYKVSSLNLLSTNRIRQVALGQVMILGGDPSGTPRIVNIDGGTDVVAPTTQTSRIEIGVGFSIQTAITGYEYGLYLSFVTDSDIPFLPVSGDFSVDSVFIQAAWDNRFAFWATNSNSAGRACVECSDTSVNDNVIFVRASGTGPSTGSMYGLIAAGRGNLFHGDVSYVPNGVDISLVNGSAFLMYMENCGDYYTTAWINVTAKAVSVLGGHISLASDGTAFKLGEQGGVRGFTIVGLNVEGISGGSNRTLFDYGSGLAYGVSYNMGMQVSGVDTYETGGPKRWATGGFDLTGELQAHAVSFPPVQRASDDPNTLDDYEEGTWTPAISFVTPGDLAVSYAAQEAHYTKVGDLVTVEGVLQTSAFTHSTASGNFLVTGLPFTSLNATGGQPAGSCLFGGITKAGYTQILPLLNVNATTFRLGASGSGQPFALVTAADVPSGGTVALYFSLTYKAAS